MALRSLFRIFGEYNVSCSHKCSGEIVDGKLHCSCGEDMPIFQWHWSENDSSYSAKLSNDHKEVLFLPVYNSLSPVARGDVIFEQNKHYYWEIKMISNLYGTDVMIGIGTSKFSIPICKFKSFYILGTDSLSWGYSYLGYIQHDRLGCKYGLPFGLGSIIGAHLDMWNGTLEYYVNRKPLGIAFRGLKGQKLHPLVSCTSRKCAVRLTCCVSKKSNLQMRCLQFIMKHPYLYKEYRKLTALTKRYDKQYFWIVPSKFAMGNA